MPIDRPVNTRKRKDWVTMVDFKEILEARYMTFSSPPTTNDALQLTSSVLDLLQSIEQRKRKRKAND